MVTPEDCANLMLNSEFGSGLEILAATLRYEVTCCWLEIKQVRSSLVILLLWEPECSGLVDVVDEIITFVTATRSAYGIDRDGFGYFDDCTDPVRRVSVDVRRYPDRVRLFARREEVMLELGQE